VDMVNQLARRHGSWDVPAKTTNRYDP
jgi:hypothetical protein